MNEIDQRRKYLEYLGLLDCMYGSTLVPECYITIEEPFNKRIIDGEVAASSTIVHNQNLLIEIT